MNIRKIKIKNDYDVILARQSGREMAANAGFGSADQTRFATAISELTRNIVQYAGSGVCIIEDVSNNKIIGIKLKILKLLLI